MLFRYDATCPYGFSISFWLMYRFPDRANEGDAIILGAKVCITAQKIKFSIKDFFSKCDQIHRKLRIWSHLLKKSLTENCIFCAMYMYFFSFRYMFDADTLLVCKQCWEEIVRSFSVKKVFLKILQIWTPVQVFSCETCEIFKNSFFYRTPLVAASHCFSLYEIPCHNTKRIPS